MQLDQISSQWYLFLAKGTTGREESWEVLLPPRGAWKIEHLTALDWSRTRLEIVSPDAYSGISNIPESLFSSSQVRERYFANLHIEFLARIITTEAFEAWLAGRMNEGKK